MAGDWIKMRTSLLTNPKVNGIAKYLEENHLVTKALATGFSGHMCEIVTRTVMRHVTVSSLLVIWGAANEHTRDGVFVNSSLDDLDDMVGIPSFGDAMAAVGWAEFNAKEKTVTLPNFNEYNTSGSERSASGKTAAQRQKEYRERKSLQLSDVTRDVTSDVTSNRREEKRREEKKEDKELMSPAKAGDPCPHQKIIELYHETLPELMAVREWTDDRQAKLRSRWKEKPERQSLEWWADFFKYVAASDFLTGRTEPPFACSLEWLVSPKNFVKVIEGKYENRSAR